MRTRGAPRITGLAQHLSFGHHVAGANEFLRQVSVPRLTAAVVVDHDGLSVPILHTRKRNDSVRRGLHVLAIRHGNVDTVMKGGCTSERILSPAELAADGRGRRYLIEKK